MNFFTSGQSEEHSLSIIPNFEEKPMLEIKQHLITCIQKATFQPLEPIYEEESEEEEEEERNDSASDKTLEEISSSSSTNDITKSSWSGSTGTFPSIASKTQDKPYEWTNFIKPENLGKTVIIDLKRKYAPFEHKKVKSALEDECDKEIVSQEWPLVLDLQNHISYFPYSGKYVVQDLKLDPISKFPGYEEKKPKGKRLRTSAKIESDETMKTEDITSLYLPSRSVSAQTKTTPVLRRILDIESVHAIKRKDFMELMDDSEQAEFQKIIEELDTKKQDDPQVKKEQKVQEELHYLSAKAPLPPKVISSESIHGDEQMDYEGSSILPESSREDEIAEDMQKGKDAIPVFPGIFGVTETSEGMERGEGSIPTFPEVVGEHEISDRMKRGEGSIPTFPEVFGEHEISYRMERGEGSIPAFPEVVGEHEISDRMERGEGSIPTFPEVVGEHEISDRMERGEGSIPTFPEVVGEHEISDRMERREGSTPVFPEVVGEHETSDRMERREGSIPVFPEVVGEHETSDRMESGEGSIPTFPEVVEETETSVSAISEENATSKSSETSEESAPLLAEDQAEVPTQREATSYIKHKQTIARIGEAEGELIQTKMHFQLLETESATHVVSNVLHSLLHDVVKTAETEAQKLVMLSETRVSKPIQINSWEEDYNICFTKYLKTLPEPIRNLMKVIPKQLKEQIYEYSSEGTSQLLDLPGISDTIKSDNLLIDQNHLVSLTWKTCSADVLPTVTDCEDEVWIPKVNAYYAYTEEVEPTHRLGHFMCTAFESLQQKYEAEELSFETENLEIDKGIRVLPNRYCLEFGTEDPYDEYLSELKYLQLKPLRCIIFGKPGLESKQLAKKMADYWRCIYINVCEELKNELVSETNVAQMLMGVLQTGDAAPGALVFRIILQRMLQSRVAHRGYILEGFPYHSKRNDIAPLEQLQSLFSWEFRPNTIIYVACPDADVVKKRKEQYYDTDTDNYYSSREISLDNAICSLYMHTENNDYSIQALTSNTEQMVREPNNLSWAKRFVRRELDFKENILKELEFYKMELLPCIEFFILQYDPQFVIRVDGRRDSSQIFQAVMQRLATLPIQKSVIPQPFFPLPPEEPAKTDIIQLRGEYKGEYKGEGKQMEEKPGEETQREEAQEAEGGEGEFEDPFMRLSPADVTEALSKRDTISPQFTWQLSGWQFNCPVLLFEGITKMGDTRFSVRYMDKLYFLSSVEALKKFCENPRRYLMPPYPKPGCKYFIVGPQYFGRSLLALYIAEVFDAKIILFEELKEKNTRKKREEHIDACRKQALEESIASTEEMLNQEWLEAENQRIQQVEKWMDGACTLLEKYMEYILRPPVETIQSSEGETSFEIPGEDRDDRLAELALLLEEVGIPIGQDSRLVENLLQNSEQLMEFLPSHLQPLPKPMTPDITHPSVCEAVNKAVFEAQKDHIELTHEELISLLDKDISNAEQKLIRKTNGLVTTGGWVIDGIPLELQLWKKLVECDMLPDHVLCLMDDKPDVQYWRNQLAFPLFTFSLDLLCKAARLRNQKYECKPEHFSTLYNVVPTTDDMVFPAEGNLPSDDDEEEQEDEGGSLYESPEMGPPNTEEDSVVSITSSNDESSASKESDDSKAIGYQHESQLLSDKAPSESPLQVGDSVISTPTINNESSDVSKTASKESRDAKPICDHPESPLHSSDIFDALFMKANIAHSESLLHAQDTLPPDDKFDASPMKAISPESFNIYGEDVLSDASFMRGLVSSTLPSSKRLSDQKEIIAWIYETWKKTIYAYHYSDFCIDYPSDKEEPESLCDEGDIQLVDKIQLLQRRQLQLDLQPLSGEYRGESITEDFVREIDRFNKDWVKVKEALAYKLAPLEINIHNRNINNVINDIIEIIEDEYRVQPEPYRSEALPLGEEMGEFEEEIKEDIFLGDTGDYCPVALYNNFVLWHGKKDLAVKYNNKVYYFSTEEAVVEFMQKPYKYAPMCKPASSLPPLRICFIGPIGSGKTMLGKMFSLRLGLKLISLNEEINKFVTAMGWMPMGRSSQNFFISTSKEGLEGEGMGEKDEESIPGQDENASGQDDDMKEYMGEHGELDEGLSFEQKMLKDLKSYYAGGLLPEWLVKSLIVPLWLSKEGFILEGFPTSPEDVQLMRKYYLIPDIIINLQVLEETAPSRVLASFLDIWRGQQDQEKHKVEEQDNEERMKYEKNKARRRKELIWKIKLKHDMELLQGDLGEQSPRLQHFGEASERSEEQIQKSEKDESSSEKSSFIETDSPLSGEDYWDFQDMPDLENWLDEQENSSKLKEELQKILNAEFPPLILAHTWEDEVHAALRLTNIIKKWYNQDNKKVDHLRKPIKEINIPWEDVNTEIPFKMLLEGAAKRASELNKRDAMLEQLYEVSLDVATSLIECGYCFLSRFGYWCPVQIAEKTNPIQMYFSAKESGNIYPIIHRKYIYFIAGQESAEKFKNDPLKYLHGEFCRPVVPVRLAIIGPPKSGKSIMAKRLAKKFGINVISLGGAIRHVLQDMADTELANNILRILQSGKVVPDDLAIMAVEAAALENRSVGQGFVYDGFPIKVSQISELAKHSVLPYAVIVLKSKKDHCLTNLHRSDLATFRMPLRYSDPYFEEMFNNWEKGSLPSFEWMSQKYQNLIFLDAEVSEWQLGCNVEQTVFSVMQNVQDYFINVNKGLPAQIQYLCVDRSEWEQRKTREILHYCPVCLKEKSLVTSGPNPDRSGLFQYLCHLYWVCSNHKEYFMRNPECYIPSSDCHLPDELPQRVDECKIEMGELFGDGLCVVCYHGKSSYGQLNKGITVNAVQYNKMVYLFCSEECLSNFMKYPHKYKDLKIHFTTFDLPFSDSLGEIPVQGFLEQAVYETIIKCLSFVGTQRPKILCTKVEISAAVYLGLLLKVNNKKANIEVRKKFKVALKQFMKRKRKVEKVTKMLTSVANPHFDWMKEIAEAADLPKVHKKKVVAEKSEETESEQELPSVISFGPCGYIYPLKGEGDTSSICTVEALQSATASDLSGYRGRAPTPRSGSGTSVDSAWRY